MKSVTTTSGIIAFKIWILAVAINTIAGSCMLGSLHTHLLMYALVGGFFGMIFSAPVFIAVWIILYILLKKRYSHNEVFAALLVSGIVMAALAYGTFSLFFPMGNDGISLLFLAIISGSTAIGLNYRIIRRYCIQRDEQELNIDQIGQEENTSYY